MDFLFFFLHRRLVDSESSEEQSEEASKEASEHLGTEQPGQGTMGQNQVSESLKDIMKGLKQSKKPQQGQQPNPQSGGQQNQNGRSPSQEKVEIPRENSRGPQQFRKDLMDAMKDKPTQGYDDQVKAYYESFVR